MTVWVSWDLRDFASPLLTILRFTICANNARRNVKNSARVSAAKSQRTQRAHEHPTPSLHVNRGPVVWDDAVAPIMRRIV